MWAHPGKQLVFMGGELAEDDEWSHDHSLDWDVLADPAHAGVKALVAALNRLYRERASLWTRDFTPEGFRWIDASDTDNSVLSFLRLGNGGSVLACIANLTPVPHVGYRIGLPEAGEWREVLNTDSTFFGGSGMGNAGAVTATATPWHGLPASADLTLPPLGVVWLEPSR
jgi:1,4-alpha-glucan branching enzyme